jgi:hypothetical protein
MNAPVRNVDWSYIACHTLGTRERPKYLEVKAGDTVAPEWFWDNRGDFYTGNHVGPRECLLSNLTFETHFLHPSHSSGLYGPSTVVWS